MTEQRKNEYLIVNYSTIQQLNKLGINNGNEIMLYALIAGLCRKDNRCTATNGYLADVLCCSERTVQNHLHDLKDKGLINTYDEKIGKYSNRTIYLKNISEGVKGSSPGGEKSGRLGCQTFHPII